VSGCGTRFTVTQLAAHQVVKARFHTLVSFIFSAFQGVSADEMTVVGRATNEFITEAYRWTAATGFVEFGDSDSIRTPFGLQKEHAEPESMDIGRVLRLATSLERSLAGIGYRRFQRFELAGSQEPAKHWPSGQPPRRVEKTRRTDAAHNRISRPPDRDHAANQVFPFTVVWVRKRAVLCPKDASAQRSTHCLVHNRVLTRRADSIVSNSIPS
jgi:hypothetical protein